MAEHITSWMARAVVEHDKHNGSNLKIAKTGIKRLVQINAFYTYREPENPRAQITGQISDRTHVVDVEFDVDATDEFESEDTDLQPERLTANKRAILLIKSYRWKVEKCPNARTKEGLELPKLKMEILKFDIRQGGDLPTFFEDTCEIGRGKDDGDVQKVMRKWYLGDSYSDMSEIDKSFELSQPHAGPSRLAMSSPPAKATNQRDTGLPEDVISLADFLEPYLADNGAKKGKAIPDWLFEITEADEAALGEVDYFGIESTHPAAIENETSQPAPAPPSSLDPRPIVNHFSQIPTIKGKERAHLPTSSPPVAPSKASANTTIFHTQTPPVPLAQCMRSTQTATQPNPNTQSPLADNEESESDGEIPVVALRQGVKRKPPTKPMFDPLAFPQSSGESATSTQHTVEIKAVNMDVEEKQHMISSDSETGTDDLSDYEREARRQRKRKRTTSPGRAQTERTTTHSRTKDARTQAQQQEDESIPASESYESYSLTKQYPPPSKHTTAEESSRVVSAQTLAVDHGAQPSSLDKNGASLESNPTNSNESSLPTPPPSDHGRQARLAASPPPPPPSTGKSKERSTVPKTEFVTPKIISERKFAKPEIDVGTRNDWEMSRSAKKAKTESSSRRVSIAGTTRGSGSRQSDTPVIAGPSRILTTTSRKAQTGPSTSSTKGRAKTSLPVINYSLDLTVDGLTTDQVIDYIDKVKLAREKLGPA